jgi:hypothetical protein
MNAGGSYFRSWPISDMADLANDVRSRGESGPASCGDRFPSLTHCRHDPFGAFQRIAAT